jgi:hypothetical protein
MKAKKFRRLSMDLTKDRGGHVKVFETFVPEIVEVSVMPDGSHEVGWAILQPLAGQ